MSFSATQTRSSFPSIDAFSLGAALSVIVALGLSAVGAVHASEAAVLLAPVLILTSVFYGRRPAHARAR